MGNPSHTVDCGTIHRTLSRLYMYSCTVNAHVVDTHLILPAKSPCTGSYMLKTYSNSSVYKVCMRTGTRTCTVVLYMYMYSTVRHMYLHSTDATLL